MAVYNRTKSLTCGQEEAKTESPGVSLFPSLRDPKTSHQTLKVPIPHQSAAVGNTREQNYSKEKPAESGGHHVLPTEGEMQEHQRRLKLSV